MDAVAFVEKLAASCSGMKVRKPVSRTSKPGSMTNKWAPGHRYQGAVTKTAGIQELLASLTPRQRLALAVAGAGTGLMGVGGLVGAADAKPGHRGRGFARGAFGTLGAGVGAAAGAVPAIAVGAGIQGTGAPSPLARLGAVGTGMGAAMLGRAGANRVFDHFSPEEQDPKVAFVEKLAAPNALTGNLGGVFQGSHGSGLLPPSPAGGVAPNVVGGSPSVTGASVATPKPKLTPPAPAAAPKMPQLDVPPPNPGGMPGGTAVPGAAGPTVAQKPVDVAAPGMMDKSHIAPTLTAQFDMQRAQQLGMHADGMPVPAGPARAPVPAPPPGLVKNNAAEAWGEMMAKQIGGKHRVRTLEEYDAKPGDFARRLAEAGA